MQRLIGLIRPRRLLPRSCAFGGVSMAQEAPKSIKVGYVISLSGPQAAGAMSATVPNFRLWVDEVNKAGGLMLKKYNKRIPIEATEIDDGSKNEDMVRLVERLMAVDKVDIVLSPWGTGPNLRRLQPSPNTATRRSWAPPAATSSRSWCRGSRPWSGCLASPASR